METQTIIINGQPVAYTTSAGNGPAVLLIHGNSLSGRSFQRQLQSDLGARYRLVAIDLPGFGRSQPVDDPATLGIQGWAGTVRGVVDALGLDPVVLVGWSLGGHIALEAVGDIGAARGVLIFGTAPIGFPPAMDQAFLPNPAMAATFKDALTEEEQEAFFASFFAPGYTPLPTAFAEDIRATDGRARAAVAASIRPDGYKDEVALIADLPLPLAIIHGAEEQLVNGAYIESLSMPSLWRGAVQVIPGAGHAPQWEQPEAFNALLAAFLEECFR
ncbi:MAG TPA: alpha/beta hydrolase [Roseiflexaceae bacterium]|nr:alpha/beta hydrolase [Roseiflexaceae bacterium]